MSNSCNSITNKNLCLAYMNGICKWCSDKNYCVDTTCTDEGRIIIGIVIMSMFAFIILLGCILVGLPYLTRYCKK